MSSVVRTSQTPNFSFHRSSTPMPYSFGKPALNCCGGSLSTFGNMKRPVAASAAADAAENAPHARPSHARRVSNGEVSSGSRVAAFATAGAGGEVFAAAAAPPADAAVVVFPARSGMTGARLGGAAGFAACAAAAGAAAGEDDAGDAGGVAAFVSSAINASKKFHCLQRRSPHFHAAIVLAQRRDGRLQRVIFKCRCRAQAAD